ncbi:MAG: DUF418 domain-containing protein [Armatimonadota bacterium]
MTVGGPVPPTERILEIDILRGFALLGILVVNMDGFAWPITDWRLGWHESTMLVDRVAGWLIRFFAQGKFFPLFSLLFGMGMAMQMVRVEAQGARFAWRSLRRLLVLFAIGVAHLVFVWAGDILTTYAVLGIPLLVFRRRRPKTLLIWAGVCLLIPIVLVGAAAFLLAPAPDRSVGVERSVGAPSTLEQVRIDEAIRVYGQGTFAEVTAQRLADFWELTFKGMFAIPIIFAMFLLGLSAGRLGIPQDPSSHRVFFRRTAWWGMCIGLAGSLVFVITEDLPVEAVFGPVGIINAVGAFIGGPALTLGYTASIVRLLQVDAWRKRLAPLAPVGRMPLTNYLLQSVICTTLFYSHGLGWIGKVGIAAALGLAALIFSVQVVLSRWWFQRFDYGPMEWVWRTLTYGRIFSHAREASDATGPGG